MHFEASFVQSKEPVQLIGVGGVHFVLRVLQLLVRVSENQSACIVSSCLDLIRSDEPGISIDEH